MPSWRKVITSGSNAALSSLYAPSITGSLLGTASYAIYAETASYSNSTTQLDILVKNQTGTNIAKGVVVRITGSNNASDIPRIVTASYENDNNSANTLGVTTQIITNGAEGFVITEGVLTGVDTQAFTSGQLVYLGATGSIIGYAPIAPLHAVRLGEVVREQSNNGSIYIRVDNGYELEELHNVYINTSSIAYGDLLIQSSSVWINSKQLSGSYGITGSLKATSFTGSLFGTSSWASNAITSQTASYVLNAVSSSFASTASYVNTLNQNVLITGSATIGATSLGASENTLTLGARDAGSEGGQLGLNAPGGTYTSASMLDNYANLFRILRGTNAGSDALVAQWNMHNKQMQLPAYNSPTAFTATTLVGLLGFDNSGNLITTTTSSGGGGGGVTITNNVDNYVITATGTSNTLNGESGLQYNGSSLSVTGQITSSGAIISNANGAMYFRGGDDAEFWDINVANTVGIYGQQTQGIGAVKLGSGGPTLYGSGSRLGIGTTSPVATVDINGNLYVASGITGSLLGTASYARQSLSASYAPDTTFPYVGSARISGSLGITGSFEATSSAGLLRNNGHVDNAGASSIRFVNRLLVDSANVNAIDWDTRIAYDTSVNTSIDWENRAAYDQYTSESINWRSRTLQDDTQQNVIMWGGSTGEFSTYKYNAQRISAATRTALYTYNKPGGQFLDESYFDVNVMDNDLVFLETDGLWYQVDQATDSSTKMLGIAKDISSQTGSIITEGDLVVTTNTGYPLVAGAGYGLPVYIREGTGTQMAAAAPATGYVRLLGHCYASYNGGTDWIMKFRPSHEWVSI
jgi:hypothetical protein